MRKLNSKYFEYLLLSLVVSLCCASFVQAASLGKMNVLSRLGAPLVAEIEVLSLTADEENALTAKIANAETFKLAGVDFNPALSNVRAVLSKEGGKTRLMLNSATAVNEPLIDVLVELNWATGRLVREYTVLLDPTEMADKTTPVSSLAADVAPMPTITPAVATVAVAADTKLFSSNPSETSAALPMQEKSAAYTIRAGDTLYALAAKLTAGRPSELSTVLANIYQNNPDAFISGDANRMKAGSVIQLPGNTAQTISGLDAPTKVVDLSTPSFNAYRQKAAASGKTAVRSSAKKVRTQKGKVSAKVTEAEKIDGTKDQLKVAGSAKIQAVDSKGAGDVSKKPSTSAKPLDKPLAEDVVAKERALAEESARKASLEKNNAELKKALAVKNDKLAVLTAPAVVPPLALPPTVKPALAEAAVTSGPALAPLPPVLTPAAPVPVAPAIVAAVPTELQAPVKPVVKPALKPIPAPIAEPAWYENLDPLLIGGLGVVLALGGGLVIMRQRKRSTDSDFSDSIIQADGVPNSLLDADGGHAVDTQHSAFSSSFSPANAGIDAAEVDPVAEADVYMQYGREAHAIEILKDALSHDSSNKAVRLKLIEVYAKVQNLGELEAHVKELQRSTGGKGQDWDQAQAIGRAVDVNNPLYGAVSKQGAPSFTRASNTPVAGVVRALPASLSGVDFTTPTAIGDVPVKQPPAAAVKAQAALGSDGSGLNFATTLPTVDFKPKAKLEGGVPSALNVSLDFDVSAPAGVTPTRMATEPLVKVESPPASIDFKLSSFDMVGVPKLPPSPAPSPSNASPNASSNPTVILKSATNLASTDFGKSLNGEQEFNTKLNLAEAYAEIGDKDGAKELLNEVIASGNPVAAVQAKTMLAKL